jgi:uncharacterized RDD family membrane protein YckC
VSSGLLLSNIDPLLDRPVASPFWLPLEQRAVDPTLAPLATRASRLGAFVVDALLAFAPMLVYSVIAQGGARHPELVFIFGFEFLVFAVVQIVLLTRDGQTVGKKAFGVRIVRAGDGRQAGALRLLLLRAALNNVIAAVVPFYVFIEGAFIFRPDRRCVHDLMAGTKVVKARGFSR